MSSIRKNKSSTSTTNVNVNINVKKKSKSSLKSKSKKVVNETSDDDDFYVSKSKKTPSPPESLKSEDDGEKSPFPMTSNSSAQKSLSKLKKTPSPPESLKSEDDGEKSPFPMTSNSSQGESDQGESDQEESWKVGQDQDSADSENESHNSEDFPDNKLKSKSKSNEYDLEKSMKSMKSKSKTSGGGNSFYDDADDDCDDEDEENDGKKRNKSRNKSYDSFESNDGSRDDQEKENSLKSASEILEKRKKLKEKRQQYLNQNKKKDDDPSEQGEETSLNKKVATSLYKKAWSICLERFQHRTASILVSLELRDAWLRIAEVEWMDTKSKLNQNTKEIFEADEPPYPLAFDTWARGALEILPHDRRDSIMDPFIHHTDGRGDGKNDDISSTDEEKEKNDDDECIGKIQASRGHSRKGRSSTRSSSRYPSSQGSKASQFSKSSKSSTKTTSISTATTQKEPEPHHRKLITEKEKIKTRQTFVKPKFVESDFGLVEGGDTGTINSKNLEASKKSELPSKKSSQIFLTTESEETNNQSATTTNSNKPYYTKEEQELLNNLEEKTSQFPFALEKLPPIIPSDKQEPLFDRKPSFFNTILPAKLVGPPSPHVSEHYVKLGLQPWNPADYPGKSKSGVYKAFGQLSTEALAEHRERYGINQDGEKAQAENNENGLERGGDRKNTYKESVEMADEDTGDEADNEYDDEQLNWQQNTGKILLRKKSSTGTVASSTTANTFGKDPMVQESETKIEAVNDKISVGNDK